MDLDISWLSDFDISYDILYEKLKAAINNDNLLETSRLVALIDLLIQSNNRKFKQSISLHQSLYEDYDQMRNQWLERLTAWKDRLQVNDQFDNYHEIDKKWYRVKLIHRDEDMIRVSSLTLLHHSKE